MSGASASRPPSGGPPLKLSEAQRVRALALLEAAYLSELLAQRLALGHIRLHRRDAAHLDESARLLREARKATVRLRECAEAARAGASDWLACCVRDLLHQRPDLSAIELEGLSVPFGPPQLLMLEPTRDHPDHDIAEAFVGSIRPATWWTLLATDLDSLSAIASARMVRWRLTRAGLHISDA